MQSIWSSSYSVLRKPSLAPPANNKSKTVPSNPQIKNKPESSNANSKAANKSKPVAVPSKPTLSYEEMLRLADENQTKKLSFKPPQTNKTEEKKQVAASKPNSSATFYRAFKHSNSLNKENQIYGKSNILDKENQKNSIEQVENKNRTPLVQIADNNSQKTVLTENFSFQLPKGSAFKRSHDDAFLLQVNKLLLSV